MNSSSKPLFTLSKPRTLMPTMGIIPESLCKLAEAQVLATLAVAAAEMVKAYEREVTI